MKIKKIGQIYIIVFLILQLLKITQLIPSDNDIDLLMLIIGTIVYIISFIFEHYKFNWIQITLVIALLASALLNFNLNIIKSVAYEIFYIIILYGLAQRFIDKDFYTKILKIVVVINTIYIVIFFIKYTVSDFPINESNFYNIFFNNINSGALLTCMSIISLIYLYKINKMPLIITIILSILDIVFIFTSNSRTTMLLIIVFILFALISKLTKKITNIVTLKKLYKIGKILVCTFICISIVLFSLILLKSNYNSDSNFDAKIIDFENLLTKVSSFRYVLWKYSIQSIKESPILGIGSSIGEKTMENIPNSVSKTLSERQLKLINKGNLHNGYIQVLVTHGIAGILLLIIFMYKNIKKIFKLEDDNLKVYLKYLLLFILITNFTENCLILSSLFVVYVTWMTLGMINGNISEDEKKDKLL